jgi:anti-sigma-K factor RskA
VSAKFPRTPIDGGEPVSDLHSLTGAYAAGALDSAEEAEFLEHLSGCSQCELEVRELLETAALMGVAAAQPTPPALRGAVLAEISRTRQLPPKVAVLSEHARRRRPGRRWTMTAAACLAVFTIGLGSYTWQLQHENSDLRDSSARIAALAAAPDAHMLAGHGGGGTAQLTMSRSANQMELVTSGLTQLPSNRTYQIWLIGPNGPKSAGIFNSNRTRPATEMFVGPGDATALAVTEEPRGGSAQPTTTPFLVMPISAT